MQSTPSNSNDGSNDNPDEFSVFRKDKQPDNIKRGTEQADMKPPVGHQAPNTASGTPHYGEFGHPDDSNPELTAEQLKSRPAGTNPDGTAAPTYIEPEQRGSAPQNLDPSRVAEASNGDYDEQRDAWADDDPRYGGGTRNWRTEEPANRSNGSEGGDTIVDVNSNKS